MIIEKNIPIPEKYSVKRGEKCAVLTSMNFGDSIVIPKQEQSAWRIVAKVKGFNIIVRLITKTDARLWMTGKKDSEITNIPQADSSP